MTYVENMKMSFLAPGRNSIPFGGLSAREKELVWDKIRLDALEMADRCPYRALDAFKCLRRAGMNA